MFGASPFFSRSLGMMNRFSWAVIAAVVIACFATTPAFAQTSCGSCGKVATIPEIAAETQLEMELVEALYAEMTNFADRPLRHIARGLMPCTSMLCGSVAETKVQLIAEEVLNERAVLREESKFREAMLVQWGMLAASVVFGALSGFGAAAAVLARSNRNRNPVQTAAAA
jgi:hypothetical protein